MSSIFNIFNFLNKVVLFTKLSISVFIIFIFCRIDLFKSNNNVDLCIQPVILVFEKRL